MFVSETYVRVNETNDLHLMNYEKNDILYQF